MVRSFVVITCLLFAQASLAQAQISWVGPPDNLPEGLEWCIGPGLAPGPVECICTIACGKGDSYTISETQIKCIDSINEPLPPQPCEGPPTAGFCPDREQGGIVSVICEY